MRVNVTCATPAAFCKSRSLSARLDHAVKHVLPVSAVKKVGTRGRFKKKFHRPIIKFNAILLKKSYRNKLTR